MRKNREILRLSWQQKVSQEKTRIACGVSKSTVWETINRARGAGLVSWESVAELSEEALDDKLYPKNEAVSVYPIPDWREVHLELRSRKQVTRQLLWEEYREKNGGTGFSFSQFCDLYRSWAGNLDLVMRQEHIAGHKMFVDFAGDTIAYWDPLAGERREAHIFVAVLGASNFTYVCASEDESKASWLTSHVAAFEFFGGVTELIVPDNPRALVTKACIYDPDINPSYTELARHYGTAVLPARPKKPRDKGKVEGGVLLTERWILARLRKTEFTSLRGINEEIARLLTLLNERPFRKLPGSRRSTFEEMEKSTLKPLPDERFEFADWKHARVNIDYHVEFDGHYYSVSFRYVRERVEIRFTKSTVEIYHKGGRIAAHVRSWVKGKHTTIPDHMPRSHREYAEWTPERILGWAARIGKDTESFVRSLIESRDHPAQGFRASLGILKLADHYGEDALNKACAKGSQVKNFRYAYIRDRLRNKTAVGTHPEAKPKRENSIPSAVYHMNIRGPNAFIDENTLSNMEVFDIAKDPGKENLC